MNYQDFSSSNLAISIVSHGQGHLIKNLLLDLFPLMKIGVQFVLTINIPEDESFYDDFKDFILVINNKIPLGFGENHNNANMKTDRDWFAVLNPDIRCDPAIFSALIAAHQFADAGVTAPRIVGANGHTEDSVRFYPTFNRILVRVCRRFLGQHLSSDYKLEDGKHISVDWVAGMFLLFKSDDYRLIGGFDVSYFMYLEDADICRRFNLKGLPVIVVPEIQVIHDARRATQQSFKHFRWHLVSMLRFLLIATWSRAKTLQLK